MSITGAAPDEGGTRRLADCGVRPNCISSTASRASRRIGPWSLATAPEAAWNGVRAAVAALPRTVIVEDDGGYLRAEARSRIFRFVDDLEVALDRGASELAVRSASRLGFSDRGVNRRRVRALEAALIAAEIIVP